MTKTIMLKDQTEVVIRPMIRDDLERSVAFFQSLPEEDRRFLRKNVTKREVVEGRIREIETGVAQRLVALVDDDIVADAALELSGHGWEGHVGELRLVVARPYQRKGLGMVMARELYHLASAEGVEEIVVKMMRPQIGAQSIFRRLGFHEEVLLPDYVKDSEGTKRDLILMRCNLKDLWRKLEEFNLGWDTRGGRA
jgi:ribosomal protein S18 acetylase RimI-like enzyme